MTLNYKVEAEVEAVIVGWSTDYIIKRIVLQQCTWVHLLENRSHQIHWNHLQTAFFVLVKFHEASLHGNDNNKL